jgi:hypothetical protein
MSGGPQIGADHSQEHEHHGAQQRPELTPVQRPDDLGRKTGYDQASEFHLILDCRRARRYSALGAEEWSSGWMVPLLSSGR